MSYDTSADNVFACGAIESYPLGWSDGGSELLGTFDQRWWPSKIGMFPFLAGPQRIKTAQSKSKKAGP